MDRAALKSYVLLWDPADLHFHPEKFPILDSVSLFGREAPLSLDIGCGTGEFLCVLARRNPADGFLGLDNAYKPIIRAGMQASDSHLENIRFLRADIRQALVRMADETFHRIYLQFPVPGSTGKGHRPRFFDENFVVEMLRILETDGILSVITDREGGYFEMLSLLKAVKGLRVLPKEEYHLDLDTELSSHNYRVWIGRGHTPHRFEAQKVAATEAAVSDV